MFFGVFEQNRSPVPVVKANFRNEEFKVSDKRNKNKSLYIPEVDLSENLKIPDDQRMHHPSHSNKRESQIIEFKKKESDSDGNFEDSSEGSDDPTLKQPANEVKNLQIELIRHSWIQAHSKKIKCIVIH